MFFLAQKILLFTPPLLACHASYTKKKDWRPKGKLFHQRISARDTLSVFFRFVVCHANFQQFSWDLLLVTVFFSTIFQLKITFGRSAEVEVYIYYECLESSIMHVRKGYHLLCMSGKGIIYYVCQEKVSSIMHVWKRYYLLFMSGNDARK